MYDPENCLEICDKLMCLNLQSDLTMAIAGYLAVSKHNRRSKEGMILRFVKNRFAGLRIYRPILSNTSSISTGRSHPFSSNFEDSSTFTFEMLLKINDDHHYVPWLHSLVMDDAVAADHSSESREPFNYW